METFHQNVAFALGIIGYVFPFGTQATEKAGPSIRSLMASPSSSTNEHPVTEAVRHEKTHLQQWECALYFCAIRCASIAAKIGSDIFGVALLRGRG